MRHKRTVGSGSYLTLSEVPSASRNARLICARCGGPIPPGARRDARYCSSPCRQAAYRRRATGQPAGELVALTQPISTVAPAYAAPSTRAHVRPVAARIEPVDIAAADHDHSSRLCAVCMTRRHESIRRARHGRVSAEIVAQRIRRDRGIVWGAVVAYGISYSHALAIRAGWRGEHREAPPIPYSTRGWSNGRKHGSTLAVGR